MAKKSEAIKTTVKCFTITVDGKKYGLFADEHRSKIAYLANSAGYQLKQCGSRKVGWFSVRPPQTEKR